MHQLPEKNVQTLTPDDSISNVIKMIYLDYYVTKKTMLISLMDISKKTCIFALMFQEKKHLLTSGSFFKFFEV